MMSVVNFEASFMTFLSSPLAVSETQLSQSQFSVHVCTLKLPECLKSYRENSHTILKGKKKNVDNHQKNNRHSVRLVLSHNNPCFPCNIAITNFLVLHTCEIKFHNVIDCTVRMFTS